MIPFPPQQLPPEPPGASVSQVRELWPLFPHGEQLRDIDLYFNQQQQQKFNPLDQQTIDSISLFVN
jgi:hypothetical protein